MFIPNYYRGAYHQYPKHAGRSSQLFNTGTVSWAYRCLIEGLCGLQGDGDGLRIQPQLPDGWDGMKVTRLFRGARFMLDIRRADVKEVVVTHGGQLLPGARVTGIKPGATYQLNVLVPA